MRDQILAVSEDLKKENEQDAEAREIALKEKKDKHKKEVNNT
jgi:hypothetical protein